MEYSPRYVAAKKKNVFIVVDRLYDCEQAANIEFPKLAAAQCFAMSLESIWAQFSKGESAVLDDESVDQWYASLTEPSRIVPPMVRRACCILDGLYHEEEKAPTLDKMPGAELYHKDGGNKPVDPRYYVEESLGSYIVLDRRDAGILCHDVSYPDKAMAAAVSVKLNGLWDAVGSATSHGRSLEKAIEEHQDYQKMLAKDGRAREKDRVAREFDKLQKSIDSFDEENTQLLKEAEELRKANEALQAENKRLVEEAEETRKAIANVLRTTKKSKEG